MSAPTRRRPASVFGRAKINTQGRGGGVGEGRGRWATGANWPRERTERTHVPLPRGHRSSHVNQAFVFVRESFIIISLFTSPLRPFPHLPPLSPPVFASPSRRCGQCGTAPVSFLCAHRTRARARAGMTLRPFFRETPCTTKRYVPSVASRFTRRGFLPRGLRHTGPSWCPVAYIPNPLRASKQT